MDIMTGTRGLRPSLGGDTGCLFRGDFVEAKGMTALGAIVGVKSSAAEAPRGGLNRGNSGCKSRFWLRLRGLRLDGWSGQEFDLGASGEYSARL